MLAAALWLGCWLRDRAAPDDVLEALARVAPDALPGPLLPAVRGTGADSVWLLLPRPGRTVGWPPGAAGAPEPAVLLSAGRTPVGLIRARPGTWQVEAADGAPMLQLESESLTPRTAARAVSAAISEAADRLEQLGLDRPARTRAADRWRRAACCPPEQLDPAVTALVQRVALVLDVLDLAVAEEGAAVTSAEARSRSLQLRTLGGHLEDLLTGLVGGLNVQPVAWGG
jgi:hypothetical protein